MSQLPKLVCQVREAFIKNHNQTSFFLVWTCHLLSSLHWSMLVLLLWPPHDNVVLLTLWVQILQLMLLYFHWWMTLYEHLLCGVSNVKYLREKVERYESTVYTFNLNMCMSPQRWPDLLFLGSFHLVYELQWLVYGNF